jgi:hypothetical protein
MNVAVNNAFKAEFIINHLLGDSLTERVDLYEAEHMLAI